MSEIKNQESVDMKSAEINGPQEAKQFLDLAEKHMNKSRFYERQANVLESQIQRRLQPERRMSEVRSLRRNAESEKNEAEKCKRSAEHLLRMPTYGEFANEFGEQTERNKSDLSKIKEGGAENQEVVLNSEDAFENTKQAMQSILNELSNLSADEMAKKFDLSDNDANTLSQIDNMFDEGVSFDGIVGYKRGACNGKQIPIYD